MITSAITIYKPKKNESKTVKYKTLDSNFLKCMDIMLLKNIKFDKIGFDDLTIGETKCGFKIFYKGNIIKEYYLFNPLNEDWLLTLKSKINEDYPCKKREINWKNLKKYSNRFLTVSFFLIEMKAYENFPLINILEEYLVYLFFNRI